METFTTFLRQDHRRCDALFEQAERAAAGSDWEACAAHLHAFARAMEQHFRREETVLFASLEAQTGQTSGPTRVMRAEHTQIRELLTQLEAALGRRERDCFLDYGDTLFTLVQQHNVKEEEVLYPATDRLLAAQRAGLLQRMDAAEPTAPSIDGE